MIYDAATQRLLDDLEAKPECFDRNELIRAARRLRFHDFRSTFATPKHELVKRLTAARYKDLADKARDGAYDQERDASEEWAASEEGRRVLAGLNEPQP